MVAKTLHSAIDFRLTVNSLVFYQWESVKSLLFMTRVVVFF